MLTIVGQNGGSMRRDAPHSLFDGKVRYPIVDGIAYLRPGREQLRNAALAALDTGDAATARLLLLRDQDDFAPEPPPPLEQIERALADPGLTFRGAMQALGFGPVATYFAHRWSAPTFLSGLGLLNRRWRPASPLVEVACGTGQILREAARRGGSVAGIDVVFAKLWLARRFVLGEGVDLLCADVTKRLPVAPVEGATVLCHDAFYFFADKALALAEMRRLVPGGSVLIGHAHNARFDHGRVAGTPLAPEAYADLASDADLYDDAALGAALIDGGDVRPASSDALRDVEAVSLAIGPVLKGNGVDFARPIGGAGLCLNPLLEADGGGRLHPAWPSPAFAREYANAAYLDGEPFPAAAVLAAAAAGDTAHPEVARLAARRVLLDLPPRW